MSARNGEGPIWINTQSNLDLGSYLGNGAVQGGAQVGLISVIGGERSAPAAHRKHTIQGCDGNDERQRDDENGAHHRWGAGPTG